MKLTKDKQISYRSRPEIVANLDLAAARLAVSRTFGGDKLRTGHLVNAVALWLGNLPEEELVAFATPLLRDLEAHLQRGGDAETRESERAAPGEPRPAAKSRDVPADPAGAFAELREAGGRRRRDPAPDDVVEVRPLDATARVARPAKKTKRSRAD